jgi:hypothetical protein
MCQRQLLAQSGTFTALVLILVPFNNYFDLLFARPAFQGVPIAVWPVRLDPQHTHRRAARWTAWPL